jgi:hypothetical protein
MTNKVRKVNVEMQQHREQRIHYVLSVTDIMMTHLHSVISTAACESSACSDLFIFRSEFITLAMRYMVQQ